MIAYFGPIRFTYPTELYSEMLHVHYIYNSKKSKIRTGHLLYARKLTQRPLKLKMISFRGVTIVIEYPVNQILNTCQLTSKHSNQYLIKEGTDFKKMNLLEVLVYFSKELAHFLYKCKHGKIK